MDNKSPFSAVILAGGSSSRMKTNKAMLKINGKTLIQIIIDRLIPHFKEILIISNQPEHYSHFGLPIYGDIFLNRGPLAGIHSGLTHIASRGAFFVACDMPFVDPRLARQLTTDLHVYQAVVPRLGRFFQPLHASYRKDCLPAVENALQKENPKIMSFYDLVNIKYFDFDQYPEYQWDRVFFNVNTPEDYQLVLNMEG
ncbi:molybdenum cofactor guanylyltransferase [Desulforamulus putei DSM 12395]|uniref:Probable molybdenum cofactor guanylyltransferase n=1 Tax=Desulforamulus putei DSM 12395 TaxID=1121429 RepID=A0A1M5AGC2_9FIRM|nr:molybdenum cofactor guanylyltransferase [Desulforamulus putei]SHF29187.1 molybdenum cofactor guanylyltransferase [Desulforamulus putei DSM 12395]